MERKPHLFSWFFGIIYCAAACAGARAADADGVTWSRSYGGAADEIAADARPCADGGFIMVGHTSALEYGDSDVWAVRLSATGSVVWERTFGGAGDDRAAAVATTTGGGFAIAGHTDLSRGDVYVVRLDAAGKALWQKTYSKPPAARAVDIEALPGGGFLVLAETGEFSGGAAAWSDIWILKLNPDGGVAWARTIDASTADRPRDILLLPGGAFIVAAAAEEPDARKSGMLFLKLDAGGRDVWRQVHALDDMNDPVSLLPESNGGFMALAVTESPDAGPETRLLSLDAGGALLWDRSFAPGLHNRGNGLARATDGGCVAAGLTRADPGANADAWLMKLTAAGDVVWTRTFGGPAGDAATAVRALPGGGFIIAGDTASFGFGQRDAWLIRCDDFGRVAGDPAPLPHRR